MEFVNATDMIAGYTLGMDASGRESIVVVTKGTFSIPDRGGEPELLAEQLPLVESDTFEGEPGRSAPVYESDYAPIKPMCDVVLLGNAHAPRGRTTRAMTVKMEVGPIRKSIRVAGDRRWLNFLWLTWPGPAKPFKTMPISYGRAFGGVDPVPAKPEKRRTHVGNHVGVGYSPSLFGRGRMTKLPVPNLERPGKPVWGTRSRHKPIGFGPVGRAWRPRSRWAGTYDQKWKDETFPFLPADFDPRFYQCAPDDQQMPYPTGGEVVTLTGLTAEGRVSFALPSVDVPIEVDCRSAEDPTEIHGVVDTIVLEPEQRRFTMTWRASWPLEQDHFEVQRIIAGRMPPGWYRARRIGKDYAGSLGATVATDLTVFVPADER